MVSRYLLTASQPPARGSATRVQPRNTKDTVEWVSGRGRGSSTCYQISQNLNPQRITGAVVFHLAEVSPGEDQESHQDDGSREFPG